MGRFMKGTLVVILIIIVFAIFIVNRISRKAIIWLEEMLDIYG